MYKKKNKVIVNRYDPVNYIDGYDIYDSLLLNLLNDPTFGKITYEITIHEYRPDLIASDIYGSENYLGILLLQIRKDITELKRGAIISVLPKTAIDTIIGEL